MGLLQWLSGKPRPRSYEAAKNDRVTHKLQKSARTVIDPFLTFQRDGAQTRRVGRWLYMNTPAARRTVRFLAQRVIGPEGIMPQFTDESLDEAFREWAMTCRRGNRKTWASAQAMMLSEFITAGEGFHRRDVRNGNLELVGFEPEQLAGYATVEMRPGNVFANGIEYDEMGIPVRYHVQRREPQTGHVLQVDVFGSIRVVHLFMEDRPGQVRGISQFATGAMTLFDMNDAISSERYALRTQSALAMHLKPGIDEPGGLQGLTEDDSPATIAEDDPVSKIAMEWGEVFEYDGDVNLLASNRPGGQFLPFVSKLVADWAVSVGIPTWVVEGDFSKANYSSMRAAEVSCRPTFEEIQNLIIDVQARPDVQSWLQWAVLTGRVQLPAGKTIQTVMRDVEWQKPGFPYVDPLKEAQADELLIGMGLKTFDQACAERGLHGRDQRWRIKRSRDLDDEAQVSTPTVGSHLPATPVESTPPPIDESGEDASAITGEEQS